MPSFNNAMSLSILLSQSSSQSRPYSRSLYSNAQRALSSIQEHQEKSEKKSERASEKGCSPMQVNSRLSLKNMVVNERAHAIAKAAQLKPPTLNVTKTSNSTLDQMSENVFDQIAWPHSVATNFTIDGEDVLIPMSIEEPSVVAAASNAAKTIRANGGFTTQHDSAVMIGQILLERSPADYSIELLHMFLSQPQMAKEIQDYVEAKLPRYQRLVERGGGIRGGFTVRPIAFPIFTEYIQSFQTSLYSHTHLPFPMLL